MPRFVLRFAAVVGLAALSAVPSACRHGSKASRAGAAGPVRVQILAFNDFHGNLEVPGPWKTRSGPVPTGGVDYFAAHIAKRRAEVPNTVVVSAGDLIGASPLTSGLFHDEPTIEAMNLLGLDYNGVGNHEFDEGPQELLRLARGGCHPKDGCQGGHDFEGAKFDFLAANVMNEATKQTLFPGEAVRTFEGVKIAFIGMTLENTPAFVPPVVDGLRFSDEADTVNARVAALREEGVEAFVVIVHEGGLQTGTYDGCEGISGPIVDVVARMSDAVDLVVTGHTHRAYNCKLSGKRVTSAGSYGRLLTDIDLTLDPETGDVAELSAKNHLVTHDIKPDARLTDLVRHYAKAAAPRAHRKVGELAAPIPHEVSPSGESPLGSVIADAQWAATRAPDKGNAELAIMNTGGIRRGLDAAGPVTYETLFSVHPFGNTLVTVSLTGAQIHQALEAQWGKDRVRFLQVSSGLRYVWQSEAEIGKHVPVSKVTIQGAPLQLERVYRVTLNNYLVERGVFTEGTDRLQGPVDLDALEAYVSEHSPLRPPEAGRVRKVP